MTVNQFQDLDLDPYRSRAVLVGTSVYETDFRNLPAVENNLNDLAQLMLDSELMGLASEHLKVIHNNSDLIDIRSIISTKGKEATSAFVFYYSGHGAVKADGFYLTVPKTVTREPHHTGLAWTDVRMAIQESKAEIKIVILDCCYSGKALKGALSTGGGDWLEQQVATDERGRRIDPEGYVAIASSPGNSVSYGFDDKEHTEFTGRLVHILQHGLEHLGPILTVDNVFSALDASIRESADANPELDLPKPQIINTGRAANAGLFRNRTHLFDPGAWRAEYEMRIQQLTDEVEQLEAQNEKLRQELTSNPAIDRSHEQTTDVNLRRISEWSESAARVGEDVEHIADVPGYERDDRWQTLVERALGDIDVLIEEFSQLESNPESSQHITLTDRRLARALQHHVARLESLREASYFDSSYWATRQMIRIGFVSVLLLAASAFFVALGPPEPPWTYLRYLSGGLGIAGMLYVFYLRLMQLYG